MPLFFSSQIQNHGVMIFSRVQAAEEKMRAIQLAAIAEFKSMLHERNEITSNSRWSKVYTYIMNQNFGSFTFYYWMKYRFV
jgi:FF domain